LTHEAIGKNPDAAFENLL
jgi:hypothetical protein